MTAMNNQFMKGSEGDRVGNEVDQQQQQQQTNPIPKHNSSNGVALPIESWTQQRRNSKKRRRREEFQSRSRTERLLRFSWSFTTVFLFTTLTGLLIVGFAVWLCNHYVQRHMANDLSTTTSILTLERVSDQVRWFITRGPSLANSLNSEFQTTERIGYNLTTDWTENLPFLFLFSISNGFLGGAWFATTQNNLEGWLVNDTNIPTSKFQYIYSAGDGRLERFALNNKLDIAPRPARVTLDYYPMKRIWFMPPREGYLLQWTPIFRVFADPDFLSVAITRSYYSALTGKYMGIIVVSFQLEAISIYLKSLPSFEDSRTFIIDEEWTLVAASAGRVTNISVSAQTSQVNALSSSDLVIRETAHMMQELRFPVVFSNRTTDFKFRDTTGQMRKVTFVGISDEYGLRWIIVSVLSEQVTLRSVNRSTRISAVVSGCCIAASFLIALIISLLILQPLICVYKEMMKISKMKFAARRKPYRSYRFTEIVTMVSSIELLKTGLRYFDAFVPSDVVRVLFQNNTKARLGVVRKRVTIMFVDLTFLSAKEEDVAPNIVVEMIQQLFTRLSMVASEHGGVIDKFMGESIMILYNAPSDVLFHELRAVQSSVQMMKQTDELNESWEKGNLPTVSIRIGINSDNCLIGNVGSTTRVNYTALGDAVNVASRLISLNTRYGARTIIGPSTRDATKDIFLSKWVSCVCVKGKSQPCMYKSKATFLFVCSTNFSMSHSPKLSICTSNSF